MGPDPTPLTAGRVLGERFTVHRVLGRGGFGIAYLAKDETRGDWVVVKELAPVGVKRSSEGILDLDRSGTSGHILRHRFLQEAETLRRLNHPGIPALRAAFAENGAAYHVTSYLAGGRTLEDKLRREGRLPEDEVREILTSLLDVLEVVHAAGVLHRDIKPSNILLGPEGQVVLIDFGAARDWVAGGSVTHTVMHTPGYAPPEQLSERAARGPATDIYALCATSYHALAGKAPPTAPDRMAEIPLEPLLTLRPGLDPALASAVEAGLAIRMGDRPDSVASLRSRLCDEGLASVERSVQRVDETLVRLQQFRFDRRACPACDGMLHEPRPLRRLTCPVCRDGTIRARDLDDHRCPACRTGILTDLDNSQAPAICPACSTASLIYRRKSLLGGGKVAECPGCSAQFDVEGDRMTQDGQTGSFDEWRLRSGRGRHVKRCADCLAQFDETADGRWRQTCPPGNSRTARYWEDWIRLAAGLQPDTGNAMCDACGADYWWEGERLTLLDAVRDPDAFAARFVGRPLSLEDARWLGVGKSSGEPGFVCDTCATEFDRDGSFLRLVASPNRRMNRRLGEPLTLEDWHRVAQDLPTRGELPEVEGSLGPLLLDAYLNGEIAFDAEGAIWQGRATRAEDQVTATLAVSPSEISFGGRFRRWRLPVDAVRSVQVIGDILTLYVSGKSEPEEFELLPITLTAHLRSGDRSIELTAEELAERLRRMIRASS